MRISDWSSDVCSSDLPPSSDRAPARRHIRKPCDRRYRPLRLCRSAAIFERVVPLSFSSQRGSILAVRRATFLIFLVLGTPKDPFRERRQHEPGKYSCKVGRASGRESVGQYV